MSTGSHQHRNTTKVSHKPFKSRFASKNELKDRSKGRVEQFQRGVRKTKQQQVMSKFDRKNQAKQKRLASHREHAQFTNVFAGKDGAPRIVAVVPLCQSVSSADAVLSLNFSLDIEKEVSSSASHIVSIDRFRQKLQYIVLQRNILSILDACRVSDYVLFVLSAEEEVDEFGEDIIRCVEGQGVSQVYTAVQGLDKIEPVKKKSQTLGSLKSFILHFFPEQEKVFSLDAPLECQNMIRSLCTTVPKGIRWREDRSWMYVEDVSWPDADPPGSLNELSSQTCTLKVTGTVRGKNLKADRLVQIGDWGDFQIERIVAAPIDGLQAGKGIKADQAMDLSGGDLDVPSEDQDSLDQLAPEEAVMNDIDRLAPSVAPSERKSVLLDDLPDFSEEDDDEGIQAPTKLPRGTSKYQSAWFLGDVSDSGSDMEDVDVIPERDMLMDDVVLPADGVEGASKSVAADATEAAMSEYPESEVFDDPSPQDQSELAELAKFRAAKKKHAEEDREFPDEVELHPNVNARERLARYRGLRSLRNSPWNMEEDLPYQPLDFDRLLEIRDYKGAKNKVLREALIGGVKPGSHVHVYLRGVPLSLKQSYDASKPLPLFSLLRHEHKRTAIDVSISLSSGYEEPLKSKDELIMQCGARRLFINPLFSQGGITPNNVHKFLRYLHPGQTAVASFIGPLVWGSVPVLFFKRKPKNVSSANVEDIDMDADTVDRNSTEQPPQFIARGTMLPPSLSATNSTSTSPGSGQRIIVKRITLTGQPYKINKKLVTVRYMFFNPDDVQYFRSLPLWTNRGRQGAIKESLGTHGYFKATFDGKAGMMDAIGISLYKRVWPRHASQFTGVQSISSANSA